MAAVECRSDLGLLAIYSVLVSKPKNTVVRLMADGGTECDVLFDVEAFFERGLLFEMIQGCLVYGGKYLPCFTNPLA
jgi:hypothetical protein